MPEITKSEKDIVRKTAFAECDIANKGMVAVFEYFCERVLGPVNVFGWVGMFCIVIGILLKIIYYFSARKRFKDYKDIIKVRLF